MTSFRRATKETQKQQRRQLILETALRTFEQTSYQEITLEAIAEQLGIARGTLYLYFKTREELFLVVLEELFWAWFDEINEQLSSACGQAQESSAIDCVVEIFTISLTRNMSLTRLVGLVPTVLEYNIELERARAFKGGLLNGARRTGALLEQLLPFLKPGQGMLILVYVQTLVIGIIQQAEPSPVIRQLLNEPEMAMLRVPFEPTFRQLFRAILRDNLNALDNLNTLD